LKIAFLSPPLKKGDLGGFPVLTQSALAPHEQREGKNDSFYYPINWEGPLLTQAAGASLRALRASTPGTRGRKRRLWGECLLKTVNIYEIMAPGRGPCSFFRVMVANISIIYYIIFRKSKW
jgi:hypothetical protein